MNTFANSKIPHFDWDELEGKMLIIKVVEDDNNYDKKCKVLIGYDPIDEVNYVLAIKVYE